MKRAIAVLAGLALAGAVPWPVAGQDTPASRDGPGTIREMERLSAKEGWALTNRALLYTRDGGAGWFDMTSGHGLDGVTDAFLLGRLDVWLAGVDMDSPAGLLVHHTNDGGTSWRAERVATSVLDSGQAYASARIHFVDASHGWLLGKVATSTAFGVGELFRTENGGASWERLPNPPAAGRFVFVDAERGFMTAAPVSERLYRTADGGRSWQEVQLPISATAGMAFYDLPTFDSRTHGALGVTLRDHSPRLLTFVTEDGGERWLSALTQVLPAGDYGEPVRAVLSASGQIRAFGVDGSITLASDTVSHTLALTRRAGAGAVSVRALSLDEEGSCWVLVAEGGCEEDICRQVTRLEAVALTQQDVVDLLVRTEVSPREGSAVY